MANELVIFQDRIRRTWHDGQWWFSVVDVVGILSDAPKPRMYWADMKRYVQAEGFVQLLEKIQQLKMLSVDGKYYKTDAGNTETILRIIQSIPSPKAEPFKRWLAKVGTERLQEEAQPSLAEQRLIKLYQRKGYTDKWIHQRLDGMRYRTGVTEQWSGRGAKNTREFATLTNTLSRGTFDITTGDHKEIKGLKGNQNLQDSMTIMELALTSLADATAITIHESRDTHGFNKLQRDCEEAGKVSGDARRQVETITGRPVVSSTNYQQLQQARQKELQPMLFETDTSANKE